MRPDAHQTLAGQHLDERFLAVRRLDRGGFGAVYEGVDRGTGQVVALKVLHPHLSSDSSHVERFRREAEIIAGLDHPHVVRVLGFFEPEGAPAFLAMELLEGESLQERLRVSGPMTVPDAATALDQLLDALDAVHRRGVVHRDLKPGNVFLLDTDSGSPRVKLLDFGVAKMVDGDTADRLTRTGVAIGTPRYMAPEQALAQPVGPHTDVWAAGLVAYAMLTGHPPWSGRSGLDITRALLDAGPVSLDGLGPPVPASLVSLVQRAVAKSPEGRFVDAGAMRHALRTGDVVAPKASLLTSPGDSGTPDLQAIARGGTAETAVERPGVSASRHGDSGAAPPTLQSNPPPPAASMPAAATAPPTLADAIDSRSSAAVPRPSSSHAPRRARRWGLLLALAAACVMVAGAGVAAAVLFLGRESAPVVAAPTPASIQGPVAVAPPPLDPTAQQPMMPTTPAPAPPPPGTVSPEASEAARGGAQGGRADVAGRAAERGSVDAHPSPRTGGEPPDPEPPVDRGASGPVTVSAGGTSVEVRRAPGPTAPGFDPGLRHPGLADGVNTDPHGRGPAVRYSILSSGTIPRAQVQIRVMSKLPAIRGCWAAAGATRSTRVRQVVTLHLNPIGRVGRVEVSGDSRGAPCLRGIFMQIGFRSADAGQEIRLQLSSM